MQEVWKIIEEVPKYEVSNFGHVRRIGAILPLVPKEASGGSKFVTMSSGGNRYSRSLKVLVANAFVPHKEGQDPDIFDTPIQCSLSTDNNRADNIVWRPLWFALQFRRDLNLKTLPFYYEMPVMNITTGNQHVSILTASLHDGVLMKDIYRSAIEGRSIFPDAYRYDFMQRLWDGLGSVHEVGV